MEDWIILDGENLNDYVNEHMADIRDKKFTVSNESSSQAFVRWFHHKHDIKVRPRMAGSYWAMFDNYPERAVQFKLMLNHP